MKSKAVKGRLNFRKLDNSKQEICILNQQWQYKETVAGLQISSRKYRVGGKLEPTMADGIAEYAAMIIQKALIFETLVFLGSSIANMEIAIEL